MKYMKCSFIFRHNGTCVLRIFIQTVQASLCFSKKALPQLSCATALTAKLFWLPRITVQRIYTPSCLHSGLCSKYVLCCLQDNRAENLHSCTPSFAVLQISTAIKDSQRKLWHFTFYQLYFNVNCKIGCVKDICLLCIVMLLVLVAVVYTWTDSLSSLIARVLTELKLNHC